ncbi:MAG: hypothetical protein WAT19_12270 [Ferruginibacter sp.]
MLTEKQLQLIKAENEFLLLQIEDLNLAIAQKEMELEELRNRANHAAELQSKLDMNLLEFEQMQRAVADRKQKASGDAIMIEELENELLDTLKLQQQYRSMADENDSLKASLMGSSEELEMASGLYKKVKDLDKELTVTKSSLEIAGIEIESLKAELKELNESLARPNP